MFIVIKFCGDFNLVVCQCVLATANKGVSQKKTAP